MLGEQLPKRDLSTDKQRQVARVMVSEIEDPALRGAFLAFAEGRSVQDVNFVARDTGWDYESIRWRVMMRLSNDT